MEKFVNAYLALFILTTFDKELLFLGFDPRYLLVLFALLLLLFFPITEAKYNGSSQMRNSTKVRMGDIALFYGAVIVSNVAWLWNGIPFSLEEFGRVAVLNLNNLMMVAICCLYRHYLNRDFLVRFGMGSLILLVFSAFYVFLGNTIPTSLMSEDARQEFVDTSIFGFETRASGFGEDPNYTSAMCLFGLVLPALIDKHDKVSTLPYYAICLVGYAVSGSKTMLAGAILAIAIFVIYKTFSHAWKIISVIIVIMLFMLPFFMKEFEVFSDLYTMSTRYQLWELAKLMFLASPIIGMGLASFRFVYSMTLGAGGHLFIQSHSTFWQVVSEHGIIGCFLLMLIFINRLRSAQSFPEIYAVVILLIYAVDFEVVYLQFFPLVVCLMPMLWEKKRLESIGEQSVSKTVLKQVENENRYFNSL